MRPRSGKSCQFILKRAVEPSTLLGFWVSGFLVSWFHRGRGRDRDRLFNHEHTGWHCSGFYPQIYTDYADFWGIARVFGERQGESLIFMKFHGFRVSSKSGSGSLSLSLSGSGSSTRDPRHSTRDDRQGRPRFRHRRSPVAGRHKV